MAAPPSYREATRRPHWLEIVAPHVRFADYPSLCRVNRLSWSLFAPRLWVDLFKAARFFGLDPGHDLTWWFDFAFYKLDKVRSKTRALVRIIDIRHFSNNAYHFASDSDTSLLTRSFQRAFHSLPCVNTIVLDTRLDIDLDTFFGSLSSGPVNCPQLLSVANCQSHLSHSFYCHAVLQNLVYLDVSGLPGSILPLFQPTLFAKLRILKVRSRELGDATLEALAVSFGRRLWGLDLSDNKLSDAAVDVLRRFCLPPSSLHLPARFDIEGSLKSLPYGTEDYGPFFSIEESQWSGTFSHPQRYQANAPMYMPHDASGASISRTDGCCPPRSDSLETAALLLSQEESCVDPDYYRSNGITHLRMSQNRISSNGIMKLLRISGGHVEELDFGSTSLLPRSSLAHQHWPASASLNGILGAADFFRPVFSSSLRTLRIHHSLVTNVPTLEADGVSHLERLYLAETSILPRVEEAYPQTFVPDMNPRLSRLTLTGIPRRSNGPLITKLTDFIKLLATQERAIQDATAAEAATSSLPMWRAPRMLQGLRHLELEFEPDPMDGLDSATDLAAEELMASGEQGFSFFSDERTAQQRPAAPLWPRSNEASHSSAKASRYHGYGVIRDTEETVHYDGVWNGETFSTPVWVGPRVSDSHGVLQEYRHLAVDRGLRDCVGPATPSQVRAGAPPGSNIFQTAWCAAVMPRLLETPVRERLAGMRDVLDEVRACRLSAKAQYTELKRQARASGKEVLLGEPHFFWTGTLSVSIAVESTLDDASSFWR
ncbi:hypothetical protein HIM_08624 [Hirsutella minnesotensis 3608]|uniref:Uncharacterized protein n=1 Tax=Hirsutella minnesotensis 3608 TaxID=1043627 RepID=A0A0F8A3J6_9HYPO|nr:hypothetical protein HIM_08624 [Hirsutella minnesotensis 3608]